MSVSRFMRGVDKQREGGMEEGGRGRMHAGVSKGEELTALYIRTKCLSRYLLLCVCVFVCMCVCAITTNARVKTCNSDHFTRARPQIYGCVSICMGVSVFSRETLCVTQDKLVFVRAGVHKT